MKTFWGWTDQQLADGTLIVTSPAGQTYVTTPGSALLFPSLCYAVGGMPTVEADPHPQDYCAERTAMMRRRTRTRAQHDATRVATERRHNRQARQAQHASQAWDSEPATPPATANHHPSSGMKIPWLGSPWRWTSRSPSSPTPPR